MSKQTEALKLALEALELVRVSGLKKPATHMEAIGAIREALAEQPAQQELTDLQKDAANLLFALHDAWPYVHQWCTIESKRGNIVHLMRKHGDFADLYAEQQQEPVAWVEVLQRLIDLACPELEETYEGRGLYDDRAIHRNANKCEAALEEIKCELHQLIREIKEKNT